ncbi:MAG: hypothetical protein ACYCZY_06205 [Lacisediminihabitans sp.]
MRQPRRSSGNGNLATAVAGLELVAADGELLTVRRGEPTFFGAPPAKGALHPLPGVRAVNTTEQGGTPGPWWNRLPHFKLDFTPSNGEELQTEYLVAREHAIRAIQSLASRLSPHLYVTELRTMTADTLRLSPRATATTPSASASPGSSRMPCLRSSR